MTDDGLLVLSSRHLNIPSIYRSDVSRHPYYKVLSYLLLVRVL